jgi:hypothetical protein
VLCEDGGVGRLTGLGAKRGTEIILPFAYFDCPTVLYALHEATSAVL